MIRRSHVYRRRFSNGESDAVGNGRVCGVECALIRERQYEGIALAQQHWCVANGEKTLVARELGISRETLYQYLRD